ncbi:uncharacterized protein ABDE67_018896 [Symphorus nematophorus]
MTAFLKQEASILVSAGSDVNVLCSLPHHVLQSYNLTWIFRRSDPILSLSIADKTSRVKVWDHWKPHVTNGLSARTHLQLHSLKPEHQGIYTCEVSTPEETYVTWTDVRVTEGSNGYIYISIIIGLVYFLGLSYGMLVCLGLRIRRLERAREQDGKRYESPVNVDGLNEEVAVEEDAVEEDAGEEDADDGSDQKH